MRDEKQRQDRRDERVTRRSGTRVFGGKSAPNDRIRAFDDIEEAPARDYRDERRDDRDERRDYRDDRRDYRDERRDDRDERRDYRDERRDYRDERRDYRDERRDDRDDRRDDRDRRAPADKRAGTVKRTQKTRAPKSGHVNTEVFVHQVLPYAMFWIALFAAVSFVLRDLAGLDEATGVFGYWFADFLCGLLGVGAYLLPLFLIVFSLRWKRLATEEILGKRIFLAVCFLLLFSAIVHVFGDADLAHSVTEWGTLYTAGVARTGGGLFGGFFGELIGSFLYLPGTILLAIPLLVIIGIYLVGMTPSGLWQRMRAKLGMMRRRAREKRGANGDALVGKEKKEKAVAPEKQVSWREPQPLSAATPYDFHEDEPDVAVEPSRRERAAQETAKTASPFRDVLDIEDDEPLPFGTEQDTATILKNAGALHTDMAAIDSILDDMMRETVTVAPKTPYEAPKAAVAASAPQGEAESTAAKESSYYAPFALPVRPEPKREVVSDEDKPAANEQVTKEKKVDTATGEMSFATEAKGDEVLGNPTAPRTTVSYANSERRYAPLSISEQAAALRHEPMLDDEPLFAPAAKAESTIAAPTFTSAPQKAREVQVAEADFDTVSELDTLDDVDAIGDVGAFDEEGELDRDCDGTAEAVSEPVSVEASFEDFLAAAEERTQSHRMDSLFEELDAEIDAPAQKEDTRTPDFVAFDTAFEEETPAHTPVVAEPIGKAPVAEEPVAPAEPEVPIWMQKLAEKAAARTPAVKAEPVKDEAPPAPPVMAREYERPPMHLLNEDKNIRNDDFYEEIEETKRILRDTLDSFNIHIQNEIDYSHGPSVTRYEFRPAAGTSVRSVTSRIEDIALNLASSVRIESPIPGKPAIGVEVPNKVRETVYMRTMLESPEFKNSKKPLEVPLGLDVGGAIKMCDIAAMPHLLVAGTTGSGKSVCINVMLLSLIYKTSPRDLRLILVDPKQVEFAPYEHVPHLYMPIVTDMQRAAGALACAVQEMERRFTLIKDVGVRNIEAYNEAVKNDPDREHLPYIVIVIDEFADLKMSCSNNDPENFTCRIAQKARAAGIHLIIGTQRPSVDVITGRLKTNIPSRIAFMVKQQVDSRTILDVNGAESLTGRGDMLYMPTNSQDKAPNRIQGAFVSDGELERVMTYVRNHNDPVQYNQAFMDQIEIEMAKAAGGGKKDADSFDDMDADDGEDPKFLEAVKLALDTRKVATSLLQRRLGVGYGRAAKIIDRMEELGLVSAPDGNKPRQILPAAQGYLSHMMAMNGIDSEDDAGDMGGADEFADY